MLVTVLVSNKGIPKLILQILKEKMEAEIDFFATFNVMNPPNNRYLGDYIYKRGCIQSRGRTIF